MWVCQLVVVHGVWSRVAKKAFSADVELVVALHVLNQANDELMRCGLADAEAILGGVEVESALAKWASQSMRPSLLGFPLWFYAYGQSIQVVCGSFAQRRRRLAIARMW